MLKQLSRSSILPHASILIATALVVSACGTSDSARSSSLNTGLDHLAESPAESPALHDFDPGAIRDQNPSDLLALIDQAQRNSQMNLDGGAMTLEQQALPASTFMGPTKPPEANRGPRVSLDNLVGEHDGVDLIAASPEITPEATAQSEPEPTPEERFEQTVAEIQMALEDRVRASSMPAGDLFRRIALGLVHHPSQVDADALGGDGALTPREMNQLEAWATFVASASQASSSAAGIDAILEPALEFAKSLDSWRPLSMTRATLCTNVEGYGIYKQVRQYGDAYKFLAGRPIRFLVYVELDHFEHTSKSQDGVWGYEVSLSQDLRLYHMALGGDALVWRLPDEPIVDFSQNKRRDFFVVQRVELPATLGVGGYSLKIAIKDNASGAVAEEIIPIEIVADIAAFQED